ncbi:MAG: hypothetical protein KAX20_05320 [Candidatus Omnitrophica bacterium]|nr:hypothetical protein [Candidatus Omnitrophota bacterium]
MLRKISFFTLFSGIMMVDGAWYSWGATGYYIGFSASSKSCISERHSGGANILYSDGHVEWKHYSDITDDMIDWP